MLIRPIRRTMLSVRADWRCRTPQIKKTTRYSDTDAVNSALQAVVMTGVHSAMHGSKAKALDAEDRRVIAFSEKIGSPCMV